MSPATARRDPDSRLRQAVIFSKSALSRRDSAERVPRERSIPALGWDRAAHRCARDPGRRYSHDTYTWRDVVARGLPQSRAAVRDRHPPCARLRAPRGSRFSGLSAQGEDLRQGSLDRSASTKPSSSLREVDGVCPSGPSCKACGL